MGSRGEKSVGYAYASDQRKPWNRFIIASRTLLFGRPFTRNIDRDIYRFQHSTISFDR
jgi:hypothetical protein